MLYAVSVIQEQYMLKVMEHRKNGKTDNGHKI